MPLESSTRTKDAFFITFFLSLLKHRTILVAHNEMAHREYSKRPIKAELK